MFDILVPWNYFNFKGLKLMKKLDRVWSVFGVACWILLSELRKR